MSEAIDRELKIFVERIVRPLPLTLLRQKRLRTELLTHLQALYAEELSRDGDAAIALARAAERFGDPSELTAELSHAIGRWERWSALLERLAGQRQGESVDWYVVRTLAGFLCFFVPLVASVLLGKYWHQQALLTTLELKVMTAVLLCYTVWFGGFQWCGLHLGQAWLRSPQSWPQLAGWSAGLCLIWPASFWILIQISGGSWTDYDRLRFTLPATLGCGVVFSLILGIVVGICHQRDMAYRREWAGLEVEST